MGSVGVNHTDVLRLPTQLPCCCERARVCFCVQCLLRCTVGVKGVEARCGLFCLADLLCASTAARSNLFAFVDLHMARLMEAVMACTRRARV